MAQQKIKEILEEELMVESKKEEKYQEHLEEAWKSKNCFTIVEQKILERAIESFSYAESVEFEKSVLKDLGIDIWDAKRLFNDVTIRKIMNMRCDRE